MLGPSKIEEELALFHFYLLRRGGEGESEGKIFEGVGGETWHSLTGEG